MLDNVILILMVYISHPNSYIGGVCLTNQCQCLQLHLIFCVFMPVLYTGCLLYLLNAAAYLNYTNMTKSCMIHAD